MVQFDTEVAGEEVGNQIAAVERLQHQDLFDGGLSFARRRTEHQQARQRGTLESAKTSGLGLYPACRGLSRAVDVSGVS